MNTIFLNSAILITFLVISLIISLTLFLLTTLFSTKLKNYVKLTAYECGFNSYSSARIMFDVHFFIVALLFLIFDIELVFLYPWSISLYFLNFFALCSTYFFLLIIILGYIYEWQKGALNWVLHQ